MNMRFSLKSFTGRSGFALSRAARAAVLALLFAALLAAAFNACGYTTRSDSAMYFGQMLKLKADYFQRNLAALRYDGPPADAPRHVTLGTEGGYAFLLRAAEAALGLRAMYHVNSVLMPLMIAALAWCAHIVAGGGVRGRLAAVLLVCLLSTPYVSRREALFLADLLRDPPSHLLGFLSLGAVLLLPGAGRRAGPLAAGMGFAIGLSAWFRLTGLMFALPIGL
ncbi:MAG: hypothetical protein FJ225_13175, partial [Lentisphaerae bacterium]|nr:hypothetical protein [Lentisphaerota bacterium]